MRQIIFLLLWLLIGFGAWAQRPSKISIKAVVVDTNRVPVAFSTVMLLNPFDSTLANFTTSNMEGVFEFSNLKNILYLLKISQVNSLPFQRHLPISEKVMVNLDTLVLHPINRTLLEVVIKAAKAPIYIKGDTIEYDASTFKVPPGSTVEDLLRKLPGIQVDANGNIMAQGKSVQKVYVDGKNFFGDDPKNVTKNLDANAISKVQVFTEKSEQTKLTGVDDGGDDKAMNLELKEEFKKGKFGKIVVAAGTQERWATRGNLNLFNEKHQLSFIGYANNINQTGVNWEDYQEFKGSNAWANSDNGNFGFSSNSNYYYSDNTAYNYFDGKGFTENLGAGTNYNYDSKKLKYNFSYFYNQSNFRYDEYLYKQNYFSDTAYSNTDTSRTHRFYQNHSASTRLQWDMDSNNVLIAKASGSFLQQHYSQLDYGLYSNQTNEPINGLSNDNQKDNNTLNFNSTAIFRHKFKKQGQSIAFSASVAANDGKVRDQLLTINEFYKIATATQANIQTDAFGFSRKYDANALYNHKFGKRWFGDVFYNFKYGTRNADNQAQDLYLNTSIDSLSYYGLKDVMYNRLGSSLRYSHKGLNVSAGLAIQQDYTHYSFLGSKGGTDLVNPAGKFYNHWTPNFTFTYQLPRNTHLRLNYYYTVQLPADNDILPVPVVSSVLYHKVGNPNLEPKTSNTVSVGLNKWNPANFSSIGAQANYTQEDRSIIYDQRVEYKDSIGIVTTVYPMNYKGNRNMNMYFWTSFPLIKTVLEQGVDLSGGMNESYAFFNAVENKTNSRNVGISTDFSLTLSAKLQLDLDLNFGLNQTHFSINHENDQLNNNFGMDFSVKYQFLEKFFFESNFEYTQYRSTTSELNETIPIWNASIRKLFGKQNKLEMRLAVFDIFNRNVYFEQYATSNYYQRVSSSTLARYLMLSVSYNIRGFSDKMNED